MAETPPAARKLPWWSSSPAAALGLDSGTAGLGVKSGSLGKLPGGEAELLRVLA
jgi:hypothetical protein